MQATDDAAHRFFERHRSKIEFGGPSECWLWTAAKRNFGYGGVRIAGKTLGAHRAAYEAKNGAGSADGLMVRHKCDVPACVNPAHLEIGTLADNNRDTVERGRHARGESHGRAKLTEADVREIRTSYVRGSSEFGVCALARRFGVATSGISDIVNRKLWTHVPTETARVVIPAKRDRDAYGRRTERCGQAPHIVFGGFQIATETWTRTEDGWDCDYDLISREVYPTADECWAAINGDASQMVRAA